MLPKRSGKDAVFEFYQAIVVTLEYTEITKEFIDTGVLITHFLTTATICTFKGSNMIVGSLVNPAFLNILPKSFGSL